MTDPELQERGVWERTVLGFPHKGGDCAGQEIRGQKELGTPTSAVPAETWGVRRFLILEGTQRSLRSP